MPFTGHAIWCQCPADPMPPQQESLLRELLSLEMLCPLSTELAMTDRGLGFKRPPSCLHWSRQFEWPWAIREADLKDSDVVLEAGASWSVLQWALAARCRRVVSLDRDVEAMEKVQRSSLYAAAGNVELVTAGLERIPLANGMFDTAICISVLEHAADPVACLVELERVLKPGGLLLFSVDVLLKGDMPPGSGIDLPALRDIALHVGVDHVPGDERMAGGALGNGALVGVICFRLEKK